MQYTPSGHRQARERVPARGFPASITGVRAGAPENRTQEPSSQIIIVRPKLQMAPCGQQTSVTIPFRHSSAQYPLQCGGILPTHSPRPARPPRSSHGCRSRRPGRHMRQRQNPPWQWTRRGPTPLRSRFHVVAITGTDGRCGRGSRRWHRYGHSRDVDAGAVVADLEPQTEVAGRLPGGSTHRREHRSRRRSPRFHYTQLLPRVGRPQKPKVDRTNPASSNKPAGIVLADPPAHPANTTARSQRPGTKSQCIAIAVPCPCARPVLGIVGGGPQAALGTAYRIGEAGLAAHNLLLYARARRRARRRAPTDAPADRPPPCWLRTG